MGAAHRRWAAPLAQSKNGLPMHEGGGAIVNVAPRQSTKFTTKAKMQSPRREHRREHALVKPDAAARLQRRGFAHGRGLAAAASRRRLDDDELLPPPEAAPDDPTVQSREELFGWLSNSSAVASLRLQGRIFLNGTQLNISQSQRIRLWSNTSATIDADGQSRVILVRDLRGHPPCISLPRRDPLCAG